MPVRFGHLRQRRLVLRHEPIDALLHLPHLRPQQLLRVSRLQPLRLGVLERLLILILHGGAVSIGERVHLLPILLDAQLSAHFAQLCPQPVELNGRFGVARVVRRGC